jgi:hypothetical protein
MPFKEIFSSIFRQIKNRLVVSRWASIMVLSSFVQVLQIEFDLAFIDQRLASFALPGAPGIGLMLVNVIAQMTPLAHGPEVIRVIAVAVMIQVRDSEHHKAGFEVSGRLAVDLLAAPAMIDAALPEAFTAPGCPFEADIGR